jgi:hypothetical protein
MNVLFDGTSIDTKLNRDFALHLETGNVAALFEKGAAERSKLRCASSETNNAGRSPPPGAGSRG